ncbi:hypothetical protein MCECM63_01576 [Methylophilaceae bacterium]
MFGLFKKKNKNDGINEDFFALAKDIVDTSNTLADSYIDKRKELGLADEGSKKIEINYEFIYFYLHYLSRSCFNVNGKSAQVKIYDPVARYVYEIIKIKSQDDEFGDIFMRVFADGIKKRDMEYGQCEEWFFTSDSSVILEDTVHFKATKRIALENTQEEFLIAAELIYAAMKMLNMNDKAKTLLKLN